MLGPTKGENNMDGLYWLIFLIAATAIGLYARYLYQRPTGMSEMLETSLAYQTLRYIESYASRHEKDPERDPVSRSSLIAPYLKDRGLTLRQRNDIIRCMKHMNWINKHEPQNEDMFVISEDGKHELETANGLRRAVEKAAQAFHDPEISADQAKERAALAIAALLHTRAVPPESRQRAEEAAKEIEEGVRAHDPDKIDHGITRTRDLLQILTLALPILRDIGRFLGLLVFVRQARLIVSVDLSDVPVSEPRGPRRARCT
jgi:hypothetical protein